MKTKISEAKEVYRIKVEHLFRTNQPKDAWKGVKVLSGYQTKRAAVDSSIDLTYVNELNSFYTRFHVHDFKEECDNILRLANDSNDEHIVLSYEEVVKSIKRIKCGKACGPDQVNAKVLRSCRDQLVKPLHVLCQASLGALFQSSGRHQKLFRFQKLNFQKLKMTLGLLR